jgi:hypothetical protein
MNEAQIAKVAADRGRRFRWPSPRNPDGSVRDY